MADNIPTSEGWLPIETAPKGERVIVGKFAWVHRTIEDIESELSGGTPERIWCLCFAAAATFLVDKEYWTDGLERLVTPTHWMPIPEAPSPRRTPMTDPSHTDKAPEGVVFSEAREAWNDALHLAAAVAEGLNGWGSPPAPELAYHIAECIRASIIPNGPNPYRQTGAKR